MLIKRDKGFGDNIWTPLSGYLGRGYVDTFQSEREPRKRELIAAYEDVIYACARIITEKIGRTPLRLYAQTNQGDRTPKCQHKSLTKSQRDRLEKSPDGSLRSSKAQSIDFVLDHPILDLLHKPNAYKNYFELIVETQAYLEMTGVAYWALEFNDRGRPISIFNLPSHLVLPIPNTYGFPASYEYAYTGGEKTIYTPAEIVDFRFPNLYNPYLDGYSPARAIWERWQLSKKELSSLGAVLGNAARPDAILSPEQPLGFVEAERLSKDLTYRFR